MAVKQEQVRSAHTNAETNPRGPNVRYGFTCSQSSLAVAHDLASVSLPLCVSAIASGSVHLHLPRLVRPKRLSKHLSLKANRSSIPLEQQSFLLSHFASSTSRVRVSGRFLLQADGQSFRSQSTRFNITCPGS
ncbi:hypothetical protein PDE_02562 [Penicillium oxalicum 114-2]|uniref:Uncharacterized protein n=1 Tax=Penicillium oxalicum (strain 114-2 / CGMCC 5302) TaxID=933388 RepID=S8ANX8_PENO1|nr:hypothetical protein PDE_02562 [Penicillium oxalicum 114-2]